MHGRPDELFVVQTLHWHCCADVCVRCYELRIAAQVLMFVCALSSLDMSSQIYQQDGRKATHSRAHAASSSELEIREEKDIEKD